MMFLQAVSWHSRTPLLSFDTALDAEAVEFVVITMKNGVVASCHSKLVRSRSLSAI